MNSDDYDDDDGSNEDVQYVRPVVTRKKQTILKPSIKTAKVVKLKRHKDSPTSEVLKLISPAKGISKNRKSERQRKSKEPVAIRYCKFGKLIDGYQFIVTEEERDKWVQAREREYNGHQDDKEVDPFQFDQTGKFEPAISQRDDEYWTCNDDRNLLIPVSPPQQIDNIEIADIDLPQVYLFYTKCSSELQVPLRLLVKKERVKWHPDKFAANVSNTDTLRKITKLFQVVNSIWETHCQNSDTIA